MDDWTPWQIVALFAVLAFAVLGFTALIVWYRLERRRRVLADMSPDDRAARLLGEVIGRSNGELQTVTIDAVLAIFARSSTERKRTLVAAITGMYDAAPDGIHNLPDLNGRVLALARNMGNAATPSSSVSE
jgi:hypothetical protein